MAEKMITLGKENTLHNKRQALAYITKEDVVKKLFDEIGPKCKVVISTELSMGQMLTDVKAAVAGRWPVGLIHRTGDIVPSSLEIVERAKKLLEGVK